MTAFGKRERGQSTLEYLLVLVIILLAIILGAPKIKNVIKDDMFNAAKERVKKAVRELERS